MILLIVADRVNVVEGVVEDIFKGKIPNIFAEQGMKAEWKYNRKGLLKKFAVGAILTTAALAVIIGNSSDDD
ncbi:hypothetical protein BH23BAC1_BH23BAC1_51110 [soil metagenome]